MEFRLLGLLEISDEGRPVDLPRGKERALLAVLLLHANQPVGVDRLVDELWGESPPENAAKTVQVYVSRLRKAIGPDRPRTTPAGYILEVPVADLDLTRFAELSDAGHGQLDGDPAAAERLLSGALRLWRGPALAEFRFDSFAQDDARRLEELRARTAADRIDARLAQGRSDVIGEAEALADAHPHWERPRGQLMRAYYRAGRQADALEVYRKTRAELADELGLEPSAELQGLEVAILNHDPALDPPPSLPRRVVARRSRKLLLAGGLAAVAVALAAALALTRRGDGGIKTLAPSSIGVVDAASRRIDAQIEIPGLPTKLAAARDVVWVGGDESRTLGAVDPDTRTVGRIQPTAAFPSAIAAGEGYVWLLDDSSGLLTRFDPTYAVAKGQVRISPPNTVYDRSREAVDPDSVVAGLGSVWATNGSSELTRIDPRSLRSRKLDLHAPLTGVAVGDGAVWVISGPDATVIRMSPGGAVARIPIVSRPGAESPFPLAIAVGAGFVWVVEGNTATVTKIDPVQRLVVSTTTVGIGHRPLAIAAGDGAAWVAGGDGSLTRIDADTGVPHFVPMAGSLRDVAVVGKHVWVTAGAGTGSLRNSTVAAGATQLHPLPPATCSPVYSASGARPQYLIASDLGFQGPGEQLVAQVGEAIQFELARRHFRAGRFAVGYQSCDDSVPGVDNLSPTKCKANAHLYAHDPDVIAVLGAWSSNCTVVELPIANRAGLAMISSSNSLVGLTRRGPGTAPNEPARYFPSGRRTYVRVIASDDAEGAADALVASQLGAHRVFVLSDGPGLGDDMAADFTYTARRLGLTVVGPRFWNYEAKSYVPFAANVAASRPDAVFLGTFLAPATVRLIKDLRRALPDRVTLLAPDGFSPGDLVADVGADAEGMTASTFGLPATELPARGRAFVTDFERATGNGPPTAFAIAAAEATDVALDAIARSNGTRRSVVAQLFETHESNGILGTFGFDRNGDTTAPAITIYRIIHGTPSVFRVITPPRTLTR
ncbi:MAG TPA: BTAD domain-containing putative transcriptional regulator [Gaiellaceae bacterium]|jgi:DNA-binding SARP family transcriptional activator/ABC-type branched-subunit amino acid transport system substrate-binding protein